MILCSLKKQIFFPKLQINILQLLTAKTNYFKPRMFTENIENTKTLMLQLFSITPAKST